MNRLEFKYKKSIVAAFPSFVASNYRLLSFGHNSIHRQIISGLIVSPKSSWIPCAFDSCSVMVPSISNQVLNVTLREITLKTQLHIFDFFGSDWVIIIGRGGVNESFVENGLEQQVEVAHDSCVEPVLVLLEDGDESVVNFLWFFVLLGLLFETCEEFGEGKESKAPDASHDSAL